MLIEFSVTNFRSFKDKQTLSFLPSGKIRTREIKPLVAKKYPELMVLPSIVVYGANNSGKSNLIMAVKALSWLIRQSGNFNSDKKLMVNDFFAFNKESHNQSTIFEIDFIADDHNRYKYIVDVNQEKIIREELYLYNISKKGKHTTLTLYKRTGLHIAFSALKGKKDSISFQKNQLFLSRADIEGNEQLKIVYSFFANHLLPYQFSENEYTSFLTQAYKEYVSDDRNKESLMPTLIETIFKEIDTGILGIETSVVDLSKIQFPDDTPQELKDKIFEQLKDEFRTKHKLFDGEKEIGTHTLSLDEQSVGTRKLLGLLPLILTALKDGDTIFIDEMNTSIHTNLSMWIIGLFNNSITNPNNAQLIITTHDILLIDKHLYERDQIYVLEKDKYLSSELYSFADITGIYTNNQNRLADFYETGRLGGVPHISTAYLEDKINHFITNAEEF